MEESKSCAYDYEHCERVWRRVAPQENPYPEARAAEKDAPGALLPARTRRDECCMGAAAVQSIEVLKGFVCEELAARQTYLSLARCVPSCHARRVLCAMAADEERHARQLSAAIYLATGEPYCPRVCAERTRGGYCAVLRQLYHEETCGGCRYFRAGEETTDYCLEQMFSAMSQDEYRHARQLMGLVSRALRA